MVTEYKVMIRGAGDIATGTIHRLFKAGFRPIVLEIANPSSIRRQVSMCEAVFDETATVEGVTARLAHNLEDAIRIAENDEVPILIDAEGKYIDEFKPDVLVDAILAKRNCGTNRDMAPLTIALGPGFSAGVDCDYVVETMRGHRLARIISDGPAQANTGVPGAIAGVTKERVIHAPAGGRIRNVKQIADTVDAGDIMAYIEQEDGAEPVPVRATIPGLIRGLIRDGYVFDEGMKIADIDPRLEEYNNCFTISDKARNIAGSVLELVCADYTKK